MTDATENQVLVDTAVRATKPLALEEGLSTVVVPAGNQVVVLSDEPALEVPNRKIGTVTLYDSASMVAYVNRHKYDATLLYLDDKAYLIQAVLNGHDTVKPGW